MSDYKRTALIIIGLAVVLLLGALMGAVVGRRTSEQSAASSPSATGGSASSPLSTGSPEHEGSSPSKTASPSSSPEEPLRSVTLHAYNVSLPNSEGGADQGLRVLVDSPDEHLNVRLHGGIPAGNQTVWVCPVKDLDSAFSPDSCEMPANNQKVQIPHGGGYEGVEVVLVGVGPGGKNETTVEEIEVGYHAASGTMQVRTPPIAVPPGASACKDNGCNPFFEVTPQQTGRLIATAQLAGIADGQLSIESGDIVAHSYAATGVPYEQIAAMEGGSKLKASGKIYATEEAALSLRNFGAKILKPATLDISWP